ncbi:hypothetical protein PG997_002036 [Apiospora hydei]|uniref:Major facilitator superfamily (MFS) profile domain-containing protein n=1 Tax=Apiospora hydei TaxID=1337664 RepID=A0ABR1X8A0_9PEZI
MAQSVAEKGSAPHHNPFNGSGEGLKNEFQAQTDPPADGRLTYTAFSLTYRWYLTLLLGYLCLASSLTANIYFPLISLLAEQYHTSIQGINLTITIYVVMQGIAPSLFSPLSDTLGRRPVYIASFALYTAASLGLALSHHSYASLVVLRALQSMGGSATLSLAYAVVADYAVHAERGRFLGPMMVATNVGPSIGPPIGGGAILATGDSRWAFWTLTIFGGSALSLILFTMRETNRKVVGNGAIPPKSMWRAWMDLSWHAASSSDGKANSTQPKKGCPTGKGNWVFPNLWRPVRILFHKDAATVLYSAASPYASWYTVTTSIPLIYGDVYGYNELVVGLCYLAGGGGILVGGLIAGRLMDWNYKYVARQSGCSVDKQAGDDMQKFPIERARSRGSYTLVLISMIGLVGYGWAVERRVHPAMTLILQAVLGALATMLHQIYRALLVDIFPDMPGTADAASNICRCATSAALVAALQPLVDAIGRSWFFTFIGLWARLRLVCRRLHFAKMVSEVEKWEVTIERC